MQKNWHFHREYELIYFLEGCGMRMVGDHVCDFQKGELVLVGESLPHLWRNELPDSFTEKPDFIVLKFLRDFDGTHIFSLPELKEIGALLRRAQRGVQFSQKVIPRVHDLLLGICESHSVERLIHFLRLLHLLAKEQDYQLLSSPNFTHSMQPSEDHRLKNVINYIFSNYQQEIPLDEISAIAHMTAPAFCRFFKKRTQKTFSSFLSEFRINKACHLLIQGEKSINRICYEVGFNSLTHFNRSFKRIKEMPPSKYRQYYLDSHPSKSFSP